MKHQRITLSPLASITRPTGPRDGKRTIWDTEEHGETIGDLPDGEAYVPIDPQPVAGTDYDPDRQRIERELTKEKDGWRIIDLTAEEIRARTVPASVTRRQLLLVLASQDPPITREAIRGMLTGNELGLIEFDEAMSFERSHPLIGQLALALGMDEATVDQLFIAAKAL
jgi:hypothetical protein